MRATHDASTVTPTPTPASMRSSRLARELHAAFELWLLPLAIVLIPYRAGIALARLLSRTLPLYAAATEAGAANWRGVTGGDDERAWRADYRFAQLVDHADLFWSLTRSRAFLLRRLGARMPEVPRGRSLLVVSFHYGQGLWLLHWLAVHGHPPRFVSIRLARNDCESTLHYAYARLRVAAIERLAGVAPIFTGGARRAIADTLAAHGTVYGLMDVPLPPEAGRAHNAMLLGRPVCLPPGLLESAIGSDAAALVLTARVEADGSRSVEVETFEHAVDLSPGKLAHALSERLVRAPAAWHFWHLWSSFDLGAREARPGIRA